MTTGTVRLDKWLWAARFFKTRAAATQAIEGGKVHFNHERSKPSRCVQVGAQITLAQGFDKKTVVVLALSDQRGNAAIAQTLYEETPQSLEQRLIKQAQRQALRDNMPPDTKPNKKDRRKISALKYQD